MLKTLYCTENNDLIYDQPEYVTKKLFKYQLAELEKMKKMEKSQRIVIKSNPDDFCELNSQMCIYGSEVGAGKTVTMLALTKSDMIPKVNTQIDEIKSYDSFSIKYHKKIKVNENDFIDCSVVIVPHGRIIQQWVETSETFFKGLKIKKIARQKDIESMTWTKEYLNSLDVLLISDTFVSKLFRKFIENFRMQISYNLRWKRVIIDEADTIKITDCSGFWSKFINKSLFTWYISASFTNLRKARTKYLSDKINSLFYYNYYGYLALQSSTKFINLCRTLPPISYQVYKCNEPYYIRIIGSAIPRNILRLINANDFSGAITALGGITGKDDDIIGIVTKKLQKNIRNLSREIECIELQEIDPNIKAVRIKKRGEEIKRYETQLDSIKNRIKNIDNSNCGICLEEFKDPVVLPCTHLYCSGCIIKWLTKNNRMVGKCPVCKKNTKIDDLMKISNDANMEDDEKGGDEEEKILEKHEQMIDIIKSGGKDKKYLVFSNHLGTFRMLKNHLESANVKFRILMGSEGSMSKSINMFQSGECNVLMLNSQFNGAGINLPMTTDVIIYHKLNKDLEKQVVGRAYRLGRTGPLKVHKLYYVNEM